MLFDSFERFLAEFVKKKTSSLLLSFPPDVATHRVEIIILKLLWCMISSAQGRQEPAESPGQKCLSSPIDKNYWLIVWAPQKNLGASSIRPSREETAIYYRPGTLPKARSGCRSKCPGNPCTRIGPEITC